MIVGANLHFPKSFKKFAMVEGFEKFPEIYRDIFGYQKSFEKFPEIYRGYQSHIAPRLVSGSHFWVVSQATKADWYLH